MRTIDKKACPEVTLLEAYISNQVPSSSERKKVSCHIKSCPQCQALATELNQFYNILEQEKKKPVSNSTFKLISDIEKNKVVIAGILLQPNHLQENKQSIKYHAEIVLLSENNGATDIDDLDCIPIDENEVFIRAIQSRQTSETTLFLYANDEKLYHNVQLQTKIGGEIYLSDDIGKIELGPFDIKELDDQSVIIIPEKR